MKTCVDCGNTFKTLIYIDGKRKTLGNRKRCLSCSPFGKQHQNAKGRVCSSCGRTFPILMMIDGKIRNLGNRKECLECTPFGSRKGKRRKDKKKINCEDCGKTFIVDNHGGTGSTICGGCRTRRYRARIKIRAIEELGGSCKRCGYNKRPEALEFHHKDPDEKDFGIGGSYNLSWKRIIKELQKCILLCANCHAEIHAEIAESLRRAWKGARPAS